MDITLTGRVTLVTGVASHAFTRGETATATLRFETGASGYALGGTDYMYYRTVGLGGVLQIGSYRVAIPSFYAIVSDNEASRYDRFIVTSYAAVARPVGGMAVNDLFFNWQTGASYRSGNALPMSSALLNGYGLPAAVIDYGPGHGNANRVQVNFSRVDLMTAVPEPAAWSLMIAGFGAVGATGRRGRANAIMRSRR